MEDVAHHHDVGPRQRHGEEIARSKLEPVRELVARLPHTGMTVTYPKALIVRLNGDASFRGVQPDITVIDDVFTPTDEILERALTLASEPQFRCTANRPGKEGPTLRLRFLRYLLWHPGSAEQELPWIDGQGFSAK